MDAPSGPFREALARRLVTPPQALPPVSAWRGIVIVAGGDLYYRLAWHLITCLRGLGCRLPVQVWSLGAWEMSNTQRRLLEGFADVSVTLADEFCRLHGCAQPKSGWELKAFALRHAAFAEVLLLDADQCPVVDPTRLFNEKDFVQTGALFWPDLPPQRERKEWVPAAAWHNVGLEPRAARPFESGQILVSRARHLACLDVALLLNQWSDYVYQWVYGDKDTFLLAWHLVDRPYAMPSRNPRWVAPAIHQHDTAGDLVFQHACGGKADIASGVLLPSIINRRFIADAAASLAAKWSGT